MKTHKWRDLRAEHLSDPERADRYAEAGARMEAELAAFNRALGELRRARAFTRAQLAKALNISPAQAEHIEEQAELYLATLASYVEAAGGRLEVVGFFDDQRVALVLGDLTGDDASDTAPDTEMASAVASD